MPMDRSDTSLLKGTILFVVLILVGLFYPFGWPASGYLTNTKVTDEQQAKLEAILGQKEYTSAYPHPSPAVYSGSPDASNGEGQDPDRRKPIAKLNAAYEQEIKELERRTERKQVQSGMRFAEWTVPAEREPGLYWADTFNKRRLKLEDRIRREELQGGGVEIVDRSLGFEKFAESGSVKQINKDRAEELLRQLFIAEMVIDLCMKAKKEQNLYSKAKGHGDPAFVRVLSVAPEESQATGPFALVDNPLYDPKDKSPRSQRSRRYNVKRWNNFILEYPIKIELQCDVNSFMRFLYSVRTEGQFLVIRNLQIVAPTLDLSSKDSSELALIIERGGDKLEFDKDQHIFVRMSAAGMEFDPEVIQRFQSKEDTNRQKRNVKAASRAPRPRGAPAGH